MYFGFTFEARPFFFNSCATFFQFFTCELFLWILRPKEVAHLKSKLTNIKIYNIISYIKYVVYIVIPLHHLKKGYPGFIHYLFFSISLLLLILEEKTFQKNEDFW